jgi:hypothetical protein
MRKLFLVFAAKLQMTFHSSFFRKNILSHKIILKLFVFLRQFSRSFRLIVPFSLEYFLKLNSFLLRENKLTEKKLFLFCNFCLNAYILRYTQFALKMKLLFWQIFMINLYKLLQDIFLSWLAFVASTPVVLHDICWCKI